MRRKRPRNQSRMTAQRRARAFSSLAGALGAAVALAVLTLGALRGALPAAGCAAAR